jgi:predicted aspartyl protease
MKFLFIYRYVLPFVFMAGIIVSLSFNSSLKESNSASYIEPFTNANTDTLDVPLDIRAIMPPETDMVAIPLKNAGRLYMIEAMIDNQSGNLIFDTGATGLVMNRTYFRKYPKTERIKSAGITGAVGEVETINIGNIAISGLSFLNMPAGLADLGHIENRRGVKVLGLIGFECFRDFEVVIDAVNSELQLYRVDSKGNRTGNASRSFNADVSQPVEVVKNIIFINGTIGGKVLKFCFDTGAETNAISSHAPKAVLNTISVDRKSSLSGAGQKTVEVLFGTMNDFVFGGHHLKNMETIITHLDNLNEAYGVQIDGMLGYNFLNQGVICINLRKRQLGMKFLKQN